MKIAIAGKGGAGKSTITSLIALVLIRADKKVLVVDGDSNPNLARVMGFPSPEAIIPISEMTEVIDERMGTKEGQGTFFSLNPKVEDIPDKFVRSHNGVRLIVMGGIKKGGEGCACPQNTFLKEVLRSIMVGKDEWIITDMEAGLEHLGRGTVESVDYLLAVVEPSLSSLETAKKIALLARGIGIKKIGILGNKVQSSHDKGFIQSNTANVEFVGMVPYSDSLRMSEMTGRGVGLPEEKVLSQIRQLIEKLQKG